MNTNNGINYIDADEGSKLLGKLVTYIGGRKYGYLEGTWSRAYKG